jgi:hypothetical protein
MLNLALFIDTPSGAIHHRVPRNIAWQVTRMELAECGAFCNDAPVPLHSTRSYATAFINLLGFKTYAPRA